MPSIFLTFRCRQCQEGRCIAAIWWDIRAINELKDKDFSARCPDCGNPVSSKWSWTKKSCGNSDWVKKLKVKSKVELRNGAILVCPQYSSFEPSG
jgi:hypothetical protein